MNSENSFIFVGDRLWIDFVNTLIEVKKKQLDLLACPESLAAWLEVAKICEKADESGGCTHGILNEEILSQAREFRSELHLLAIALAEAKPPPEPPLNAINVILASRDGHPQIVHDTDGYRSEMVWKSNSSISMLAPIAEDVLDFLTSGNSRRVGKCENPKCVLYFLDTTKNQTRRWCDMDLCGNRMKAAAHYQRKKFSCAG